jgi:hypothetical protein
MKLFILTHSQALSQDSPHIVAPHFTRVVLSQSVTKCASNFLDTVHNQTSNMTTDQGETNKFAIHAACRDGQSACYRISSSDQSILLTLHQSISPNHY